MAHFYAQLLGKGRKELTRTGTKSSGIWCHIRGWHVGVEIYLSHDAERNVDIVEVYQTPGSGQSRENPRFLITTLVERSWPIMPELDDTPKVDRAFEFEEPNA